MRRFCIFLIAETPASALIEEIRKRLDPLSGVVPAHVTVVFPFPTGIPVEALISHVSHVSGRFTPIETSLVDCHFQRDGYIHLSVLDELRQVRTLHTQLYSGLLHSFLDVRFPFEPHITIGRYTPESRDTGERAVKALSLPISLRLSTLILEEILDSQESNPVLRVTLGK